MTGTTTGTAERQGRRLHWSSQGSGSPVVVLEAGQGMSAVTWVPVARELARTTRVVTYDRVGLGGSPPAATDAESAVSDLLAVLEAAGVEGPAVLVGHSWGAVLVRLLAARRPGAAAALVLVDGTHEDLPLVSSRAFAAAGRAVALVGAAAAASGLSGRRAAAGRGTAGRVLQALPHDVRSLALREASRPATHLQAGRELAGVRRALRQLPAAPPPVPVVAVVGTAARSRAETRLRRRVLSTYEGWLAAAPLSRVVTAPGSGHLVPLDEPDLVARVVAEVVEDLRAEGEQC